MKKILILAVLALLIAATASNFVIAAGDSDGDGLPDFMEIQIFHTNPFNPDTDGGKAWDGMEVLYCHTDPLNPNDDQFC